MICPKCIIQSAGPSGLCVECFLVYGPSAIGEVRAERMAEVYKIEYDDELDRLNREHRVITDISQLNGWRVAELIRFKPGVVKYIAYRHSIVTGAQEQMIGYAKDSVFAALQLPP